MCGIIGIVGTSDVGPRLLESLRRLEYRGYDSAGIAGVTSSGLARRRAPGKIRALEEVDAADPLKAAVGIGHTRWATHGPPTEANAHPHRAGRVMLVHNGIIENYAELKAELAARGRAFESDTDTEVVAALLDETLETEADPVKAFQSVVGRLHGAYSLAVLVDGHPDLMLGARRGSPLVVGWGDGEMFLGSDALAVGPFTQRITYLEDGDSVVIDHASARIFDEANRPVERPMVTVPASAALVEKGNYRHFMEKEIHEQPESCQRTLSAFANPVSGQTTVPGGLNFAEVERIQIIACGTAFYAGEIGRYAFEKLAGLPCDVEVASEFRYRQPALTKGTLALAVSQSGETADTLAGLTWCKAQGFKTACLVNVHTSSMAREAEIVWPTWAGPEIGVASTKAFTAQVSALLALAVAAARQRGRIDAAEETRLVARLFEAPGLIAQAVADHSEAMTAVAHDLAGARDVLFLGRGAMFPLAMEGALKLKEISYIHAEGYAAGELKHGPIALIDEATPVVVLAPPDEVFEKTVSNVQEVAARGAEVILITSQDAKVPHAPGLRRIVAPDCDPFIAPLVYAVPVQLLAYLTAVQKGTDVDQPRNLAKSVTVE
ncbi:glutamine--fructose-6-phosphate transaminase (isomerizing) [Brevundimonas sp. 2R-24]|uniref:Glutamine--fructose-6-phosphate aminotransferase [isomerizing] n=1 Tax=Peiella sedimenti TaxID=3061083 RepID=A0ABT8SLK2_9CAUL|nr:glutamine--fructose-6-phosphate transaminase (isomerizing) [Caulobacteraceae bacterium XZ-24]